MQTCSCVQRVESLESRTLLSSSPTGLTPAEVRHAYGFDRATFSVRGKTVQADGTGQTIAIVSAYNDPNIASDLATFDSEFGLSTTDGMGNGVLTVVKQTGTTTTDAGWALETSLDVEWAHAIVPGAHILLVEAKSASMADLLWAVNYARQQSGVVAVSMSWGTSEFVGEWSYDSYFTTPTNHIGGSGIRGGVAFVTASGDDGAGTSWPAVSPNVLSVGGTSLTLDSSGNYLSETAWSGSGGGYSYLERTTNPDVAYDASPSTGFSVYDSVAYNGESGWFTVGGTSAGAPQWSALIAIADQGRSLQGKGSLDSTQLISAVYKLSSSDFNDITTGNNGAYSATAGYDLVTGRGSPKANLVTADLASYTTTTTRTPSLPPGRSSGPRFAMQVSGYHETLTAAQSSSSTLQLTGVFSDQRLRGANHNQLLYA